MSDIEDRLKTWFAGEVSRAERDLATSKARTARRQRRQPIPGLALAGLLVAVVVVVLAVRPSAVPDTGKGPQRSATSDPVASGGIVAFGADGLPTVLDGEPVLRVPEAHTRLAAANPTRVLVGGFYSLVRMRCAAANFPPTSPLLPYCNPARLSAEPEQVQAGLSVVPDGVTMIAGWVVLRVHTGDARAFSCSASIRAQCDRAIVVEEVAWHNPLSADPKAGRYADGIPGDIDGELVIRVTDLAGDGGPPDGSFLLGGWHRGDRWFGCGRLGETHPLLDDCSPERIADTPGGVGPILVQARDIPEGSVVIRVHTNDPRSDTCPELERRLCAERLVVDALVWAGDVLTDTEPLRIDDVVVALRQDVAGFAVEVDRPSRTCDPGWPHISWVPTSGSDVTTILVFPTIADREAVDQNFRSSGWTGIDGCSVDAYGDPWHWVAVDNVMVSTTEALAEQTRMRLEAAAP